MSPQPYQTLVQVNSPRPTKYKPYFNNFTYIKSLKKGYFEINMTNKKHFLIIDDDSDDREFFREALFQVFPTAECNEAIDGVDALQKLRMESRRLPDYIFLDLNMPRMDGKSLLLEVKKDCMFKHIPVFILSTSSDQQDKKDVQLLGAAAFITKPFELEKLCKNIQAVLEPTYQGQV
jgi:CheY-like chemotaxis protein